MPIYNETGSGGVSISGISIQVSNYIIKPIDCIIILGTNVNNCNYLNKGSGVINATGNGVFGKFFVNAVSGKVNIFGHSINDVYTQYVITYREGDVVFIKEQALKGVLEPVAIRRIVSDLLGNIVITKYITSFNEIFFDIDLVDQATAVSLATTYQQNQILKYEQYINSLN
jgi:hypothetical protein